MKIIRWIEDQILYRLQRRCNHPGDMVAVDILEGCHDEVAVKYCRRCGAVNPDWKKSYSNRSFPKLEPSWRLPDPNLWRG